MWPDPFPANDEDARVERARLAIRMLAIGAVVLAAVLLLALVFRPAEASARERDRAERAQFQRANPCPANGARRGACPGYEIDHVVPLCAGGRDHRTNMQWLTVREHRQKTTTDVRACRRDKGSR